MVENDDKAEHPFPCIIAGGGTGGHLFPGIAVAREIERRVKRAQILFVVGLKRMESEILSGYGYRVAPIHVEGLKGRGLKRGVVVMLMLPKSLFQSFSILNAFSPRFVLGMGGYSAGPVCLAAKLKGIPTAIHEQNSYPGLTNRILSRSVDRVFISFEESRRHFKRGRLFLTGSPVREELFRDRAPERNGSRPFTILVMGGSQGAKAINDAFVGALFLLQGEGRSLHVIHQTGEADHRRVMEMYRDKGLKGEVLPFIRDMAEAYENADLVVSRAGASTIFELAALGKPSILIPFPYAANQHQETNALALVRVGGAKMIRQDKLSPDHLAQTLAQYMDDREALEQMGQSARKMARPNAAGAIVDHLLEMAG